MLRSQAKDLQDALNLDRSKRLKLMHQNDTLQKHNDELIKQNAETEEGSLNVLIFDLLDC